MSAATNSRAPVNVCPYCGEEDLRPQESGGWHCRACLRLFSVTFHGLQRTATPAEEVSP